MITKSSSISVIVVNYRKGARLIEGLKSLRTQSLFTSMQVVVVDNSVEEGEANFIKSQLHESEIFIAETHNSGYSKACNKAAQLTPSANYIVLMNPDIILDDMRAVEKIINLMERNIDIAVLAPLQKTDSGMIVEVARRFPSPIRQIYRRIKKSSETEIHLSESAALLEKGDLFYSDWVQSSFAVIAGDFWRSVRGLDETYFVFMADVQLGKAARDAGKKVALTADVIVRADGIRASRGNLATLLNNPVLRIHVYDSLRYYFRNFSKLLRKHA